MINKIFALLAVVFLSTAVVNAEVVYPSSSMAVAYVSDAKNFEKAFEDLKDWAQSNPSVKEFLEPIWSEVDSVNPRELLLRVLDMSPQQIDTFFSGEIVMAIGSNMELLESENMLPASLMFSSPDEVSAKELLAHSLESEGMSEADVRVDGEYSYYEVPVTMEGKGTDSEPVTMYVSCFANRLVMATTLDFLKESVGALKGSSKDAFWDKVDQKDSALWVKPAPLFAYVRAQLQKAQDEKDEEQGFSSSSIISVEMFDKLALNDLKSVGAIMRTNPFEIVTEVTYNPDTNGVYKVLSCQEAGIVPIGVIPANTTGFNVARMDLACLWGKIKEIAGSLIPPSMGMYYGWVSEVQSSMGVNVDTQFFGALGGRQFVYQVQDDQGEPTSVFLFSLTNPKGFQSGLEAMWSYFAQGQSYFEKEMVNNVPVWRMKSQYQTQDVPPVTYAINAEWLIVTFGDPVAISDVIDRIAAAEPSAIWENKLVAEALEETPNINGLAYRPLKSFVAEVAAALVEYDIRRTQSQLDDLTLEEDSSGEIAAGSDDINMVTPLWDPENIPSFDDVEGSVVTSYSIDRGLLQGHLKISLE